MYTFTSYHSLYDDIRGLESYQVARGGLVDIHRMPHPTVISATVRITDIRIPGHR